MHYWFKSYSNFVEKIDFFLLDKVVKLVSGGSVINRAYPVYRLVTGESNLQFVPDLLTYVSTMFEAYNPCNYPFLVANIGCQTCGFSLEHQAPEKAYPLVPSSTGSLLLS